MATIKKIEAMHKRYGIAEGHKCKDCCNLITRQWGNKYFKCSAYGTSCSTSTDWAKRYPACGLFGKEVEADDHRALSIKIPDTVSMDPMAGQIELEVSQNDT